MVADVAGLWILSVSVVEIFLPSAQGKAKREYYSQVQKFKTTMKKFEYIRIFRENAVVLTIT